MKTINKLKLKTLLAGAITVALFLTIAISSLININGFSSMFYKVTEQEHLPNVIERAKSQIESKLQQPIALSKAIAQDYFVQKWLSEGEDQSQLQDIINYLNSYIQRYGATTVFWVTKESHNYYTETGLFKKVSEETARDQWFFDFIRKNNEYALNLDSNETTKALTVFVNVLAKSDHGEALGVAGLGYDVSSIIKLVKEIKVGETGYMLLVNEAGEIVAHRDNSLIGQPLSRVAGYRDIASQIEEAGSRYSLFDTKMDNQEVYLTTTGLSGIDWKLVAVLPKAEISGKVNAVIWLSVTTAFILAAIFIIVSLLFANSVSGSITQVGDKLMAMSASGGDLTQRLDDGTNNELGYLAQGFNAILAKFSELVKEIIAAENDINHSVKLLFDSSESSVKNSEEQRKQIEAVASAINELGLTVNEVSSVANHTATSTTSAVNDTQETNEVVHQLSKNTKSLAESMQKSEASISELAGQAESINSVVDVISGISEQTNLLALNAAIEAARAGEQGRGFAVVADEVRTLASRTQDSTNEIRTQIEQLQQATSSSLSSIEDGAKSSLKLAEHTKEASDALDAIRDRFEHISDGNNQVATAAEEQSTVLAHVNESAQNIATMATDISDTSQSQIEEVNTLSERAQHMRRLVNQFRV